MGLKKLSGRHLDIIRRLIVGQTIQEINIDLGLSLSRISILKADPLFAAAYYEMENRVTEGFIETRASAMEILEDAAPEAAKLTRDAIMGKEIGGVEVPLGMRMKSAWDCLDRTGNKAVDKHLVGHVDLAELIGQAYQEKHGGGSTAPTTDGSSGDGSHNPGDAVDGEVREVRGNGGNGAGENAEELGSSVPRRLEGDECSAPQQDPGDEDLALMVMEDYATG